MASGKKLDSAIIEELIKLRKAGFTQQEIAEKLNTNKGTVRKYSKYITTRERRIKEKRLCTFPGCKRKYCAKGLCNSHWTQQKREGRLYRIFKDEPKEEKFWRLVNKLDGENNCWLWIGPRGGNKKYGSFCYGGSHQIAHRMSYELHYGKIPDGMQLDHLCRNTMCVNPKHLEIVTRVENMRRMKFYYNMLCEINRLRNLVQNLGGSPGADIFASSKLYGNSKDLGLEETF